jgi:hypothetical protein
MDRDRTDVDRALRLQRDSVGGWTGGGDNSSEIFDPSTATFQMAQDMLNARVSQTATLLADTRVLIAGGNVTGDTAAEFYDP